MAELIEENQFGAVFYFKRCYEEKIRELRESFKAKRLELAGRLRRVRKRAYQRGFLSGEKKAQEILLEKISLLEARYFSLREEALLDSIAICSNVMRKLLREELSSGKKAISRLIESEAFKLGGLKKVRVVLPEGVLPPEGVSYVYDSTLEPGEFRVESPYGSLNLNLQEDLERVINQLYLKAKEQFKDAA